MTPVLPPGYRQLEALHRDRHAGLQADPQARAAFLRQRQSCLLTAPEFVRAARDFPIVFVRDGQQTPEPQAVLTLQPGNNGLPDAEGHWPAGLYQPAWLRRWPFATATLPENPREAVVCVDPQGLAPGEQPWFTAEGPTPEWEPMQALIRDFRTAEEQTLAFVKQLDRLELLEPFSAQPRRPDLRLPMLQNLWRVSETRLHALPPRELKKLATRGYLARIYAHLMSLENFSRLLDRIPEK